MWADYYEKYRGTPKFGMNEQQKLEAQARLEGLKNAYMMNMLTAKLGNAKQIAANKVGGEVDDSGNIVPQKDESKIAPEVAATIKQKTAVAGENDARKAQIEQSNKLVAGATGGGTDADGAVGSAPPKLTLTSVGPRGATLTNLGATGEKDLIAEEAQLYKQQGTKVDAAIHAHTLLDSGFDPKTGQYDVSKVPLNELGSSLATIITNNPGTSEGTREAMTQKSLQGDIAGLATYFTGHPINAITPANAALIQDQLVRQGSTAEDERDQHATRMGTKPGGTSFKKYLTTSASFGYARQQRINSLTAAAGQSLATQPAGAQPQPAASPKAYGRFQVQEQ